MVEAAAATSLWRLPFTWVVTSFFPPCEMPKSELHSEQCANVFPMYKCYNDFIPHQLKVTFMAFSYSSILPNPLFIKMALSLRFFTRWCWRALRLSHIEEWNQENTNSQQQKKLEQATQRRKNHQLLAIAIACECALTCQWHVLVCITLCFACTWLLLCLFASWTRIIWMHACLQAPEPVRDVGCGCLGLISLCKLAEWPYTQDFNQLFRHFRDKQ